MTDKIRVGIVGATVTQGGSGWGANAHVPALKALPQYELAGVGLGLRRRAGVSPVQ
jgi:predicted dehydrogenase